MSILQSIESIKYLFVLDLVKNDETFDKKRSVITGDEVFKLCHERYQFLQSLLLPLKERLGNDIEIIDVSFIKGMQNDTNILVKYNDNNQSKYFTIFYSDLSDVSIELLDGKLEKYDFANSNKRIIRNIYKKIHSESLDTDFYINSTSKKFVINDNCNIFSISDINESVFSVEGSHSVYDKNGLMYDRDKIISYYKKLKELLVQDDNILNIYRHIHVYEEDFSKILKKN